VETNNTSKEPKKNAEDQLLKKVGKREVRKLKARREPVRNVLWSGLYMTGVVGWLVSLPTVIGALIGKWLDSALPERFSWTLTLLFVGLIVGCANAWYWLKKESKYD
jgi:ATP synthase protein I